MKYTRVSSREQQQEGFSLEAQKKLLREYAATNGLRIVQAFEDVETAKTTGRKQFARMVDFFRRNRSCRVLLVEKTDRISRNFRDAVTLEDLDIEIHFVKEGHVISKDAKSQAILMYGFNLILARHYSNNLREEVKKGMHEKAARGIFPGYAPFGYRNNRAERTIEVDPDDAPIVSRMFTLYASGLYSLSTLVQAVQLETGRVISRASAHHILTNTFYVGFFKWGGESYRGTHPEFIDASVFERVQAVLSNHNRPEYARREIVFRGLMQCAYDGCALTGEIQKERYVYYHCTGNRGRCALPWFREEDIAERLGELLKEVQVSARFVSQTLAALCRARHYRVSEAQRIFELANNAHFLYSSQGLSGKARLLNVLFDSCLVDAVSVVPVYRRPFDMIYRRARPEEWLADESEWSMLSGRDVMEVHHGRNPINAAVHSGQDANCE